MSRKQHHNRDTPYLIHGAIIKLQYKSYLNPLHIPKTCKKSKSQRRIYNQELINNSKRKENHMNQNVDLKNIKLFKNEKLELAPLTIITGINNSGKTLILNTIKDQYDNVKYYKYLGLSIFQNNFINEKDKIILLNQPETGLHPKLQLEMADILLNHVRNGLNIVVETHSDHFINRIVRRYLEDKNIRNKIKIYFIDEKGCEPSNIENMPIDETEGVLCPCGNTDFFYQFALETEEIINAAYTNQKNKYN